jgi:hypothetical protein
VLTVDALGNLDEIAEQTAFSINPEAKTKHVRGPGRKISWGISPNMEHSEVAREKKPKPIATKPSAPAPLTAAPTPAKVGELVTCYTELIQRLRDRVWQLEVRYLDFDKLAGFADGLSGKVFGESQVKRLGVEKLFDGIRAAGLRLRIEEDPEQTQKMQARIAENFLPRQANQARPNNHSHPSNKMVDGVLSYLANTKGGLTQLNDAMKKARSNWARQAAKALWGKKRKGGTGDFAAYLGNVSRIGSALVLRSPDDRKALDSQAESEATEATALRS